MKKVEKAKKGVKNGFPWTLLIEFNGLCAAELVKSPKEKGKHEMIIHFVNDAMHHPILAVRDGDVLSAQDCRPDCKVLVRGETAESQGRDHSGIDDETEIPTTISLWSALRGSHQQVRDRERWMLEVDTGDPVLDGDKPKYPESLRWLPMLDDILGSKKCNPLHDFVQFRLTEGKVIPGRLDLTRRWRITAPGFKKDRSLAVTIIYKLVVNDDDFVVLDLHPGLLKVGPSALVRDKLANRRLHGYMVEMTYSSLPVSTLPAHQPAKEQHTRTGKPEHPSTQHFNEYNRLVGTDKVVIIEELDKAKRPDAKTTVEDPIHCFGAGVLP